MKARTLLVLPVLAAVLITGACQGGGDTANPGGEPSLSQSDAVDINFQPRENLAQGGELRLSVGDIQDQWNGAQAEGNTLDTADMLNPVLPSLYYVNESGVPTWDPDYLASEPKAVVADDKLTVTYDLNPKAVWGDGTQIGVKDFEASWKALNGTNKEFSPASTEGYDQMTAVTQGANAQQIVVAFKATYPDWTAMFGSQGLFRAESVATPDAFNNGWKKGPKKEWLSGPFMFDSITPNLVTEVPNPDWWGDKPLLGKITFKKIEDSSAVPNAFANGEIDSFDIGSDSNAYSVASKTDGTEIRRAAGPNFRQFTFNSTAGNVADPAVRRAIVQGLDRQLVADSDLAGTDWPAKPLNNMLFMQNQPQYVDLAEKTGLTFDAEAAKKTLDEAGWKLPDGATEGVREKDGKKLMVKFSQLTGVKASENEALQLQNQMKPIGIDVQIVPTASTDFNTNLVAGKFEIMAFSWIGTPYPFASLGQIYATGSDNNFAKSKIDEVDKAVPVVSIEMDPAKRATDANAAAEAIWNYVHTLPLYQRPDLSGNVTKLANWGSFGLASARWQNVGFTK